MTPKTPQQPLPQLPQTPTGPPVFGNAPVGQKPKAKNTTSTFLNTDTMASPGNLGGKKLLGE